MRAVVAHGRATHLADDAQTLWGESQALRRLSREAREARGHAGGPADAVETPIAAVADGGLQALREQLRADVCAYAVALRHAGEPPERMLRLVKEAVAPALRLSLRDDVVARIADDVVRWSLDAYYAA